MTIIHSLRRCGLSAHANHRNNTMPLVFSDTVIPHSLWGGQSWPQAGLPAGWTRWKANPQAEKPAPQFV
jgi:hypothetical protein